MVTKFSSYGTIAVIVNNKPNSVAKYAIPLQMLMVGDSGCRLKEPLSVKGELFCDERVVTVLA